MKIVSGRWKGRNFYPAKGSSARPTSNIIREALFNMLYGKVVDAVVVDLFAGAGGFGFEALSRGASEVHFCDIERKTVGTIKGYLEEFKADPKEYLLYFMDYKRAVSKMESFGVNADIIYVDPPYKAKYYKDVMERCKSILKKDGLIIFEHDKKVDIETVESYIFESKRRYGTTMISTYQYKG